MQISPYPALSAVQAAQVRQLTDQATQADGVSPLNELALLAVGPQPVEITQSASLEQSADPQHQVTHFLLTQDAQLLGYAQADADPASVQLVVAPGARRQGLGTALAERVQRDVHQPDTDSLWWSFGDLPAARALAGHLGLQRSRELLFMTMPLLPDGSDSAAAGTRPADADTVRPSLPSGISLRSYTDADLDALVRVNRAAFAHHPEQSLMDAEQTRARMGQDWFRADDLLLAVDQSDQVVGFHWMKIVPPIGEVYVLGVDPTHAGGGIGRGLLQAGIVQMRARGAATAELYVEASEPRVVQLYRQAGFEVRNTDVGYTQTNRRAAPNAD